MKKVSLIFPTMGMLWHFTEMKSPSFVEVKMKQQQLTCTCSEQDIQFAIDMCMAQIIGEIKSGFNQSTTQR